MTPAPWWPYPQASQSVFPRGAWSHFLISALPRCLRAVAPPAPVELGSGHRPDPINVWVRSFRNIIRRNRKFNPRTLFFKKMLPRSDNKRIKNPCNHGYDRGIKDTSIRLSDRCFGLVEAHVARQSALADPKVTETGHARIDREFNGRLNFG